MGLLQLKTMGKGHPFTSSHLVAFAEEESDEKPKNAEGHPYRNRKQKAYDWILDETWQASHPSVEAFKCRWVKQRPQFSGRAQRKLAGFQ